MPPDYISSAQNDSHTKFLESVRRSTQNGDLTNSPDAESTDALLLRIENGAKVKYVLWLRIVYDQSDSYHLF